MVYLPFKGVLNEWGTSFHHQGTMPNGRRNQCADLELNFNECLEAYGVSEGKVRCEKFFEDYNECNMGRIRQMRFIIMRNERLKKVAKGELKWKDRWGHPFTYDSYVSGSFFP